MPTIVVPFRGTNGKQRLGRLPDRTRVALSLAMLGDVLAACTAVADTYVATSDDDAASLAGELGATIVPDSGGGQGAAVADALQQTESRKALVVNADVPCVLPDDIHALAAATPADGLVYVAARDGTTNALGLSHSRFFAPLYGPGSAERFRLHALARDAEGAEAAIANLRDDVDELADLERVYGRLGPRTRAVMSRQ